MNRVMYSRILFVVLLIVLPISLFHLIFPVRITKEKMDNEFYKNRVILESIVVYLDQLEYTSVYITDTDKKGEMFVSDNTMEVGKHIYILNNNISDQIEELFKKYHFEIITKEENVIYFQRWSNRDYGRGILFSFNGRMPSSTLLTKLEPINEENWYFYEEE